MRRFPLYIFLTGSVIAGFSVIAGAFGSHAFKETLATDLFQIYQVAVQYQMYSAFGLIALSFAADRWGTEARKTPFRVSAICFLLGILFFSGSLYLYTLIGADWAARVTPFGGILMMIGWLAPLVLIRKSHRY